jgi:serine/threonine protein kinase
VAVRLGKPLDTLTEEQLGDIFGEPRRRSLDPCFRDRPSPGPKYAVETVDLSRLPAEYLSTRLCILDFDEAFLANSPAAGLAHIPAPYLAPESIFSLTNGPEGDIWALGCILYSLRRSASQLFWDLFASGPMAAAIRMHEVLGPVPQEWYTFPFLKVGGHPVYGPRQPGTEYRSLEDMHMGGPSLEQLVRRIVEPRRPENSTAPRTGAEKFCIKVPEWDMDDDKGESQFIAKHTTPIEQEDAELFANLLRQIFTYDHRKRITATQVLEHPWMVEPRQRPLLGKKKDVQATAQTGKSKRGAADRCGSGEHVRNVK